ncbi:DUF7490 domain-containing protein [Haloparvum sedimenti]|uniref:DUF7490 domain-containing protein n=1 Tax=Haloparvum sedimenti TaxID=1678448 RepID=UPI00071E7A85|nr:CARDB domain-containing protein [Haloparvum sedimenti]
MNRESTLAVVAALLLLGATGLVLAAPDALDDPRSEDAPPGHLAVAETAIAPGEITGETAALRIDTGLRHRGGALENVSVRYRAVDSESGLLVDERRVELGEVTGDGEVSAAGTLVVPREGGYRIETTVFADGERVASDSGTVRGVAALTPDYADRRVGFPDHRVWPTLAVAVDEADGETATLRITASVTNRGDDPSEAVELAVLLRQSDSNVVADRATTTVEAIRPGRTETVDVTVTVPDDYNYYVDAMVRADGVVVDEAGSVANLNPRETISANETTEEVAFNAEDFAEEESEAEAPREEPEGATDGETPGFGAVAAVLALLSLMLAGRLRRRGADRGDSR